MESPSGGPQGCLSLERALELVRCCFSKEWPNTVTSDAKLRRITGGFVNEIYVLSRNNAVQNEPRSVLIRLFGTTGSFKDPEQSSTSLSASEQAVVSYVMASRGWGPKIYGLFTGGRVEEWIDSHPLTAIESMDPIIRRDIARSYARLHSLDLPLKRDNFRRVLADLLSLTGNVDQVCQKLEIDSNATTKDFTDMLRNTQWADELNWVYDLLQTHHCKATPAIGDTNFLNVLVKNHDSECRTMLIDYETVGYSFRGIDIGGHFNERMYTWSHPDNCLSGYAAPSADEQREFCELYCQELEVLELNADSKTTVNQLLLESKIGRLWQLLFSFTMCLGEAESLKGPAIQTGLLHMIRQYQSLKAEFKIEFVS